MSHSDQKEPNSAARPEEFFREIEIQFLIHELKDPIKIRTDKTAGLGTSDFQQIVEHLACLFGVAQSTFQRIFLLGNQGAKFFFFLQQEQLARTAH